MCKTVRINECEVTALIDTGSPVNLIKESIYKRLGSPEICSSSLELRGFGNTRIRPIGCFCPNLFMDGNKFSSNFHIVPDNSMTIPVIIGNELLSQTEILITGTNISIRKIDPKLNCDLMAIDLCENITPDIGPDATKEQKQKVENLILSYHPEKTKTTDIQMKIALKDDQPIYHSPRRLPFSERKIVDDQVEEWLKDGVVEPSTSEYSSQVVVVKKKNGSPRVSSMRHVDALSRYPVMNIQVDSGITATIEKAQAEDPEIVAIKELIKTSYPNGYQDYFLNKDILYKFTNGRDLLVVPNGLQYEIIKNSHEHGHFAAKKIEESLKQDYYIPKLKEKIDKCLSNCIQCILVNKKKGKQEGFLNPLLKNIPLHTYHIDHIGPLESTNRKYNHILSVIDGFTKFAWLYPTKSTTAKEVIEKLEIQKKNFGNPAIIISDRGSAFQSKEFQEYCDQEAIKHHSVTTGLPRANGQIERLNSSIKSVLTKLSLNDPTKWYQHVNDVQRIINSTHQRSIGVTPFELLIGVKMRSKSDMEIKRLLEEELLKTFDEDRNKLREEAKKQILKVQEENRKTYNLRRRPPTKYRVGDIVAIKRTQLGSGLKMKPSFLGPYKVLKEKSGNTYDVVKMGQHEGPTTTSTCAEYMKPWAKPEEDPNLSSEPADN